MKNGCRIGLVLVMIPLFFYSCATMKKEECLFVDWYNIGFEDGAMGYQTFRISSHRKACSKYGVTPDLKLYQKGRSEGLYEYCTPHKAYTLGLNGRAYNDVCQDELQDPFAQAYNVGRDVYLFKKEVLNERRDQDRRLQKIIEIDQQITQKETELSNKCKNPETCKQFLNEIRDLDRQKRKLKSLVRSKKDEIEGMEQTLYDMTNQNRF